MRALAWILLAAALVLAGLAAFPAFGPESEHGRDANLAGAAFFLVTAALTAGIAFRLLGRKHAPRRAAGTALLLGAALSVLAFGYPGIFRRRCSAAGPRPAATRPGRGVEGRGPGRVGAAQARFRRLRRTPSGSSASAAA